MLVLPEPLYWVFIVFIYGGIALAMYRDTHPVKRKRRR